MEIILQIFGEGKDLSTLQMCCRAVVIFFIALIMVRLSGRRTFGKHSAFDNTLAIILGAILSRAVVGASAFVPTVVSCLVLVLLHRLLAWLSVKNEFISRVLKGDSIPLYRNGKLDEENIAKSLLSEKEVMGDLRLKGHVNNLDKIKEIYMETSGELSVIKKD
ncbi:DUF421 domain-containing protein [Mucilaginibacter robiniae]|uniref:DUF421 domain-containing protein n=1 Tax=Mucilaginibacter robiniae TaxID=2728022 RepID=A0A7L5E2L7_9SPHI|nr:YetF domain-containing protein [Mucilaginibacter robiniae]QJD95864.1 DUF421 domain-containing protein [Mucilaginibacter robiniae]